MKTFVQRGLLVCAFLLLAGQGCFQAYQEPPSIQTSGPGGFFISQDKGESWQPHSTYPTASGVSQLSNLSVWRLNIDPQDPNAFYWATRGNGLFFSYDAVKPGNDQVHRSTMALSMMWQLTRPISVQFMQQMDGRF